MSDITVPRDEHVSQDGNVVRNAFDIKRAVESDAHDVFGYCINHRHIAGDDESSESNESSDEEDDAVDKLEERQEVGVQQETPMTYALFHDIFDKWLTQRGREAPRWSNGSTFYWHYVSLNLPHFRARVRIDMFCRTLAAIDKKNTNNNVPLHEPRFGMDEATFERVKSMFLLQYLHDHCAEPSPFGDVRTVSTQTDTSVRKARQLDLDASSVDAKFLEMVQDCWSEQMYPAKVRVEPYKLNLYDADGLFKPHKDTPADQLVGTFLVGLGYTANPVTGAKHLKIHPGDEASYDWPCHGGDWCAIYSDVVHEVVPFAPGGMRGTMAFKIYADESNNERDAIVAAECAEGVSKEDDDDDHIMAPPGSKRPKLAESQSGVVGLDAAMPSAVARQMSAREHKRLLNKLNNVKRPFGFLLSHEYSMGFTTLKGIDARLKRTLELMDNVELAMFPVVTRINKDWGYDEDSTWETSVAAFSSGHVDRILARPEQAKNAAQLAQIDALMAHVAEAGPIPMVVFSQKSFDGVWSKHSQEAGVTGNEACPGSEHSIYLQAALIVLEKK